MTQKYGAFRHRTEWETTFVPDTVNSQLEFGLRMCFSILTWLLMCLRFSAGTPYVLAKDCHYSHTRNLLPDTYSMLLGMLKVGDSGVFLFVLVFVFCFCHYVWVRCKARSYTRVYKI